MIGDGGLTLTGDECALVSQALALARTLCFEMEADKHRDNEELIEVRLLVLTERLETTCLGSRLRAALGEPDDEARR